MFTCYNCGKGIKGAVKHTGVCSAARMTGWNSKTSKPCDLDFPKAFHPACHQSVERAAELFLRR